MNAKPTTKPAPLGRGLSALFGDTDASYRPAAPTHSARSSTGSTHAATNAKEHDAPTTPQGVRSVPVECLMPGSFQPRRVFDEAGIEDLASSIAQKGILQPLIVRPAKGAKGDYEIICGERRWRAAQKSRLHEVPVLIRDLDDREAMEVGLIENIQRQDLSPIEEAEGYFRLIEEFSHTHDNLAKIVGKSRPHIGNMLRLLKLPVPVKKMIMSGELSMGHARCLITAVDPEGLAKEVVKRGLNVRQTELLAKKKSDGRFAKTITRTAKSTDPNVLALENELTRSLGLKVKISVKGELGTLTVHFSDLDQLEGVIKRLGSPQYPPGEPRIR